MKLLEIRSLLNAKVLTGQSDVELGDIDVETGCGCDLLSDVLAFVKDQGILLTGLVNLQVLRTAEMMDINAICFVRGKTPGADIIDFACQRGIPVLTTDYPLFKACGKLYQSGLMQEKE